MLCVVNGIPLFLRISSTDYVEGGNTLEDLLVYAQWMKEQYC